MEFLLYTGKGRLMHKLPQSREDDGEDRGALVLADICYSVLSSRVKWLYINKFHATGRCRQGRLAVSLCIHLRQCRLPIERGLMGCHIQAIHNTA
ncbi:hypothetical protein QCA50_011127 [Cerrena zonata]|uniref:Uncharacterized protein n=1 Tax=Cerrena zonata TaxID=2478898 RepID=A0AAW0FY85_9APHY